MAESSSATERDATADEELWLDIFETMVRGGVLPETARDRVALGLPGGVTALPSWSGHGGRHAWTSCYRGRDQSG